MNPKQRMNIVLDQGNTLCKIGFFDNNNHPVFVLSYSELTVPILEELFLTHTPERGILSTVIDLEVSILHFLDTHLKQFVRFNHQTPIPIGNHYGTPSSLGLDRLAAAVGAWFLKPNTPLLIIDVGTAITYDFVQADGVYQGGNIAPGLRTRLKSLHHYTGRLPLVEPSVNFPFLGRTTDTAILAGVMQGILFEMDGYFDALKSQYENLFAFLTGGDLIFFVDKLKSSIFVCDNLVLAGLNRILCFHDPL